jgi:transcriptional regulator with XRE-family HTH domain
VSTVVSGRLEKKLAVFLRKHRGDATYRAFARTLGMSPSMLFRFEQEQASMTLESLQRIMSRLRVSMADIFGEDEVFRKGTLRDS